MGQLEALPDSRRRRAYGTAEIVMAALSLFLFQDGSRNRANQNRVEPAFAENYYRLFGLGMPHLDTVNDFLCTLDEHVLEDLKALLVQALIGSKVFYDQRLLGKYFLVAIDGSGIGKYDSDPSGTLISKTYESSTVYFRYVLEAKLVTASGLCLSLATEWVENKPGSTFDKQDCEAKAFKRLAAKLKGYFPKERFCILADGLYPNDPFFTLCRELDWRFLVTLKEGNLPLVQQQLQMLGPADFQYHERYEAREPHHTVHKYRWRGDVSHRGHLINWISCEELRFAMKKENAVFAPAHTFVYVTDIAVSRQTIEPLIAGGRLRWTIENQGFNTQKNGGYALEHRYARSSPLASKNYYQCLQIAHMIHQMVQQVPQVVAFCQAKLITWRYVLESLRTVIGLLIIEPYTPTAPA